MTREWWVLGTFFCCWVQTRDGIIVDTAPILRKFIGQPGRSLEQWRHYVRRQEITP